MAAAGAPAIMDPAGPVPYRFEPDELACVGGRPGAGHRRAALQHRRPRDRSGCGCQDPRRSAWNAPLAESLAGTDVDAAWLVESESDGRRRLMLGLLGAEGAAATVDVPDGTDVVWLEEPLLASVRAVAEPFYRRGAGDAPPARRSGSNATDRSPG